MSINISHNQSMGLEGWQRVERIQFGAAHYTVEPHKGQALWFRTAGGSLWQYRVEDADGKVLEEAASTEPYTVYFKRQPLKQRFRTALEPTPETTLPPDLADAQDCLNTLAASRKRGGR